MTNLDKLIAKALSTDSEDEAIACLRMARKQGKLLNQKFSHDSNTYEGKTAKQWYYSAIVLSRAYASLKVKYSMLVNAGYKRANDLEKTVIKLYVAIPLLVIITAILCYFAFSKTIVASCWVF